MKKLTKEELKERSLQDYEYVIKKLKLEYLPTREQMEQFGRGKSYDFLMNNGTNKIGAHALADIFGLKINRYKTVKEIKLTEEQRREVNELLMQYEKMIIGIASKVAYKYFMNYDDKEDLIQEAFLHSIKLYTMWDKEKCNFGTWITNYLAGRLMQSLERSKEFKTAKFSYSGSMREDDDFEIDRTPWLEDKTDYFGEVEMNEIRKEFMDSLNDTEIMIIAYTQGHTYKEMSEITKLSITTCVNRVKKLKEKMNELLSA